jgi:hypothetical protein
MTTYSHIKETSPTRTRRRWVTALRLAAVACCSVVLPLIDPCGWSRADAQAPTGHRQPSAADVPNIDPSKKSAPVSPADQAMDRALNNICRGCSTPVAVGNVPRYDVAAQCRATARSGQDENSCRRDEEGARDQLKNKWTQFATAARSSCIQTAAIGRQPSYVELLTCLQATVIAPTLPDAR